MVELLSKRFATKTRSREEKRDAALKEDLGFPWSLRAFAAGFLFLSTLAAPAGAGQVHHNTHGAETCQGKNQGPGIRDQENHEARLLADFPNPKPCTLLQSLSH
jgi:hypothetical protein